VTQPTLAPEDIGLIDAYWRAANYLSVGQIYLLDNPLLHESLQAEHVKPQVRSHIRCDPAALITGLKNENSEG
jgi:xylulose-5-phosphate/fructose-6-phosphate phosphoketolase